MKNKLQRTFHFSLHPSTSSGDGGGQGRPVGRKSPSSSAHRSRGGVCVTEVEATQWEAQLLIVNVFCTESLICLAIE